MAAIEEGTVYLGDGLYAEHDGIMISVFAHDGVAATDTVYLENFVLENFEDWIAGLRARGVVSQRRK